MPAQISTKQIEIIEDLPLSAIDRWYVLLALSGNKKASWLHLQSDVWREGDEPIAIPDDQLSRVKASFELLGILYHVTLQVTHAGLSQPDDDSEKRTRYNQLADFFIGRTETDVDELFAAYNEWDHRKIGLALGFPKSAVDVFLTKKATHASDAITKKTFSKKVIEHTYFMLSPEHADAELAVVEKWYKTLEQNSTLIKNQLDR